MNANFYKAFYNDSIIYARILETIEEITTYGESYYLDNELACLLDKYYTLPQDQRVELALDKLYK